jgi:hypothetical protein
MDDDGSSFTAGSTYSPLVTAANPTRSCVAAGNLAGSSVVGLGGFRGDGALVSRLQWEMWLVRSEVSSKVLESHSSG